MDWTPIAEWSLDSPESFAPFADEEPGATYVRPIAWLRPPADTAAPPFSSQVISDIPDEVPGDRAALVFGDAAVDGVTGDVYALTFVE